VLLRIVGEVVGKESVTHAVNLLSELLVPRYGNLNHVDIRVEEEALDIGVVG